MSRRAVGRAVAGLLAAGAFVWAARAAADASMPEFKVYDGFWMMLGIEWAGFVLAAMGLLMLVNAAINSKPREDQ